MLVASMNPCPCGYYNHPTKACVCTTGMIQKYLSKISGPLLDRIDMHIEVIPVEFDKLAGTRPAETSGMIRERVIHARGIQAQRYASYPGVHSNAQISRKMIEKFCRIDEQGQQLLKNAMEKRGLSARAYDRILKVARTIADLEESENIQNNHLAEAIQYRSLDREGWGG